MGHTGNRRDMIKAAALASAGLWLNPGARSKAATSPAEKLNIVCVGLGNQGNSNLGFVSSQNIVALCDVDDGRTGRYAEQFPRAQRFADFRRMLDRMDQQIDAVVVTTPNHSHATIAIRAMNMGKHVYCEKPLTHSIFEAREMQRVAREKNVVTQMGVQNHAGDNYRRCVELIQSGAIGDVKTVHVWFGKPGGFRRYRQLTDRPAAAAPIPAGFNWDLWVGPAPMRPFHPCYHPHDWHYWWDFGNGTLGNMGCHYMDLIFWALKLKYPTSVETRGPERHPDSTPFWLDCHWQFPARDGFSEVEVIWYHGRGTPEPVAALGGPDWSAGVLFVGDDGMLAADYNKRVLLPEDRFADFTPPDATIPDAVGNHRQEWIEACRGNGTTLADFDYAAPLTETILLGNLAFRVGKKINWDAERMQASNSAKASEYVHREYRKGWSL
ncbi:MAG: Gfo/Idh/MocA family oxidoreductase [Fuerstiella sp.]